MLGLLHRFEDGDVFAGGFGHIDGLMIVLPGAAMAVLRETSSASEPSHADDIALRVNAKGVPDKL